MGASWLSYMSKIVDIIIVCLLELYIQDLTLILIHKAVSTRCKEGVILENLKFIIAE